MLKVCEFQAEIEIHTHAVAGQQMSPQCNTSLTIAECVCVCGNYCFILTLVLCTSFVHLNAFNLCDAAYEHIFALLLGARGRIEWGGRR